MLMKTITRTLTKIMAALLLCTGLHAYAQDYLVELVVFGQPGAQLVPAALPGADWADRAVLLDEGFNDEVRALAPHRHQLEAEARKLESSGYQIKLHRAWQQPADSHLSVAVHQGQSLATADGQLLYPAQALVSLSDTPLTARVTLWLYHATAAEPVSERLQVTRSLRLDQTHYLDHRSLGALIRVTRP
ncbi:CsiV family protein [Halopseudomonas pertucinogena]|uniref:Peptidoglycan-binding protein CsiV n=1 Tax=Halopseudomonas pertucinogena TaxID=86175 RepID=A0ABQ2CM71_9GAMM|nr:CsiV family protein [Halopseudomonas pertucinogena]GGI94908.1 hypothetical protein GCM10009083_09380 [Halopseudomonas pertucinogena]